jgi:hypothetical protein
MRHTNETGLFYFCLPDRTLQWEEKCQREGNSATVCVNSDDSDKQVSVVVGKPLKPLCFKHIKITPYEVLCK